MLYEAYDYNILSFEILLVRRKLWDEGRQILAIRLSTFFLLLNFWLNKKKVLEPKIFTICDASWIVHQLRLKSRDSIDWFFLGRRIFRSIYMPHHWHQLNNQNQILYCYVQSLMDYKSTNKKSFLFFFVRMCAVSYVTIPLHAYSLLSCWRLNDPSIKKNYTQTY